VTKIECYFGILLGNRPTKEKIKLQINFSVSQFYVKGWQPAHTNFSKNLVKLEKENLIFRKFTAQIAAILLGKLIQILNTK
jgi:hypothetical protein